MRPNQAKVVAVPCGKLIPKCRLMNFVKVPYDPKSTNPLVQNCLRLKMHHVGHTHGIGPVSCCAVLKYNGRGRDRYLFGNSQLHMPVMDGLYTHDWMKCHGEASAAMFALHTLQLELGENGGDISALMSEIYIELKPCERCEPLLQNLNPNMTVYYSFDHPGEIGAWEKAATTLCK
jgi:hypothetical protein